MLYDDKRTKTREDITFVNIYAPTVGALTYIKTNTNKHKRRK